MRATEAARSPSPTAAPLALKATLRPPPPFWHLVSVRGGRQLTVVGAAQAHALGDALRERYGAPLLGLRSRRGGGGGGDDDGLLATAAGRLSVRSTNVDRCVRTARGVVEGLLLGRGGGGDKAAGKKVGAQRCSDNVSVRDVSSKPNALISG